MKQFLWERKKNGRFRVSDLHRNGNDRLFVFFSNSHTNLKKTLFKYFQEKKNRVDRATELENRFELPKNTGKNDDEDKNTMHLGGKSVSARFCSLLRTKHHIHYVISSASNDNNFGCCGIRLCLLKFVLFLFLSFPLSPRCFLCSYMKKKLIFFIRFAVGFVFICLKVWLMMIM